MYLYLIYKTTCLVNNKIYIGQHKTLNEDDCYLGSGKLLRRAIKKYGVENFERQVLYECDCKEDADIIEEFCIEYFDSTNLNIGYNITKYAWGGQPITEEAKAKISTKLRGITRSEETKSKMSEATKKRKKTKEQIEKQRTTLKAKNLKWYYDPETNESKRFEEDTQPQRWIRGRKLSPLSEETKRKISNSLKGKKKTEEHNKKVSESLMGHEVSQETRDKISKTLKERNYEKACDEKND